MTYLKWSTVLGALLGGVGYWATTSPFGSCGSCYPYSGIWAMALFRAVCGFGLGCVLALVAMVDRLGGRRYGIGTAIDVTPRRAVVLGSRKAWLLAAGLVVLIGVVKLSHRAVPAPVAVVPVARTPIYADDDPTYALNYQAYWEHLSDNQRRLICLYHWRPGLTHYRPACPARQLAVAQRDSVRRDSTARDSASKAYWQQVCARETPSWRQWDRENTHLCDRP